MSEEDTIGKTTTLALRFAQCVSGLAQATPCPDGDCLQHAYGLHLEAKMAGGVLTYLLF